MMTGTETQDPSGEASYPTRPYPPSWLERVTARVQRLPGRAEPYYLLLFILQLAYVSGVLWLNGKAPVGTIDLQKSFFVVLAPYFLWVRYHLDRVAGVALRTFRPALTVNDAEFSELSYRLTTLPAREARIVTAGIALASLWGFTRLPASIAEQYAASRETAFLAIVPLGILALVTIAVSTWHAIHQLRMVAHIHRLATQIELFRPRPLYAFSRLTASTGMSFLLIPSGFLAILPEVLERPIARTLLVAIVPIGVASFVLPLIGMHRRIAAGKERLLAEANRRLETMIVRLHQRVDEDVVSDADKVNAQMAAVIAGRALLERMSTWPWNTETMTAFVTTLVLPLLVWLLTRVLERGAF